MQQPGLPFKAIAALNNQNISDKIKREELNGSSLFYFTMSFSINCIRLFGIHPNLLKRDLDDKQFSGPQYINYSKIGSLANCLIDIFNFFVCLNNFFN